MYWDYIDYEITFAKKTNNKNSMLRKTSRMFASTEAYKSKD